MKDLILRFSHIIDLLELIERHYGTSYKLTLEQVRNYIDENIQNEQLEQYIKFLAGFSLISMYKKENNTTYIIDIDIITCVFYAKNFDNIIKYRSVLNDSLSSNREKLRIAMKIFKQDRINHCSECCDYYDE